MKINLKTAKLFTEIIAGDIIQITDDNHAWFPAILIVDEVLNWGVSAVALIPQKNDGSEPIGTAFTRMKFSEIKKVGEAEININMF